MRKWKIKNWPLYLVFCLNCISAARTGTNWCFWVSAGLTAVVLIWDVVEALRRGREEK